jgi:hypothetical protein
MWEAQPTGQVLDVSQTLHKAEKAGRLVVGLRLRRNYRHVSKFAQAYSVTLRATKMNLFGDFREQCTRRLIYNVDVKTFKVDLRVLSTDETRGLPNPALRIFVPYYCPFFGRFWKAV